MRFFFKYALLLGLGLGILGSFVAAGAYAYLKPQLPDPLALREGTTPGPGGSIRQTTN